MHDQCSFDFVRRLPGIQFLFIIIVSSFVVFLSCKLKSATSIVTNQRW